MTENHRDVRSLEERLRDHYQRCNEHLPAPGIIWARVQPHLDEQQAQTPVSAQHVRKWSVLPGLFAARRQAVPTRRQEEDQLMKSATKIAQAEALGEHLVQRERPSKRHLRHALEAAIAALVVVSLVLGWLTVVRWRNAQGNGPALFTYTSQPGESVYDLQWTPDGEHLVFALSTPTNHYRYQVWDAANGKIRQTLAFDLPSTKPGSASVPDGGVTISSDARYLLITAYNRAHQTETIKLATIMTGQIKLIYQGKIVASQLAFSNAKDIAFIGADGHIHIWNIATGKTLLSRETTDLTVNSYVSWSADGKRVITASVRSTPQQPGRLQVWDAQSGNRLVNITETPDMSLFLFPAEPGATIGNISPDGTRILTYNRQMGTFEERELSSLKMLQTFHIQITQDEGHTVFFPYWMASGTRLFLLKDQTAYIWNALTGQLLSTIPQAGNIKAQPFGRYIALWQAGKPLVLRDVVTGANVRTITPAISPAFIFWSSDGKYLNIKSERDSYGQLYDVLTDSLITNYQGDEAILSPDRQYVATSNTTSDPKTGDPLKGVVRVLRT